MRSILCLGFVIWSFIAKAIATNKALIFNFEKSSLIQLPGNLSNLECKFWAVTCPAKNEEERIINEKHSTYNRALFLQRIYSYNTPCNDLKDAVCQDRYGPYEISMILLPNGKIYEFGYEVFHRQIPFDDLFRDYRFQYYPMKKFGTKSSFKDNLAEIGGVIQERDEVRIISQGVEMKYFWIPLVRVELYLWHFRRVEYEIHGNNVNPWLECNDHSLGKEIIEPSLVDQLYTKRIQKELFVELKLPTETDEDPQGACTPEYECLTKWPLLPTDQYQFGSYSPLICSNLTTIPVWKSTLEKIMKKLDKYLYVLHRLSGQPLRVQAGVHEILSLPRKNKFLFLHKDIILGEENTMVIETPKIIYKLIELKLNPCEKDQNCWYGVLIVIHNGPYRPVEKDLICADQSKFLGWEEIQYETRSKDGAQSKFIYVCEIIKLTMSRLGLPHNKRYKPLSLLEFPFFDENKTLVFKPLKEELFDEMERLSESGNEVKLDGGLIERPFLGYNFGLKNDSKDS